MAYQMYITDALVCGSRNSNTSDKSYLLFAREAGMLWASARSVREERSKQRFALQEFSHVRATLVRGKGGWRIAGVEPHTNFYFRTEDRGARTFLRNTVRLLCRVLQGESAHASLFDDVIESLSRARGYDPEALELVLSLRVLSELGYVGDEKAYSSLLTAPSACEGARALTDTERASCVRAIEHGLLNSQL